MSETPTNPVAVLHEARALIAEKGWTQGWYALDAKGSRCPPASDGAVCFCSAGALRGTLETADCHWIDEEVGPRLFSKAYDFLGQAADRTPIHIWNDEKGRTRGEVLVLFDKAILLAEAESAKGALT